MENSKVTLFWFRRDLRIEDNTAFFNALNSKNNVLPLFIFDTEIIDELEKDDSRITFIYSLLNGIIDGVNNNSTTETNGVQFTVFNTSSESNIVYF